MNRNAGLFISAHARSCAPSTRGLGGTGSSRSLVLVDGVPLNDAFGGWLYRVAASAIVDRARRAERDLPPGVRVGDLDEPDVERRQPLVGDAVATAEFAAALDREQLRTALRRLTEPQRRILVLKFFDDLSTPELCTALGVSAGTLAIRLQRALRALHQAVPGKSTHAA